MSSLSINEARRQIEICNACRYCEGYCAVFPAITRHRTFNDGDVTQLANLCHNCRGCYYACQYTDPHEFALNLPKVLAEVRQQSWQDYAVPKLFARCFHESGLSIALAVVVMFGLLLWLIQALPPASGEGFYAVMMHTTMVAIFTPAFLLPLVSVYAGLRRYWRAIGGSPVTMIHLSGALKATATLKNLAGGHGEGCNYETEDQFSNARRWFHQATLYGFLACFIATSAATILHYAFDLQAPYTLFSLPKLFGISGGILLCIGTIGLALLKLRADTDLGDVRVWGGEMGFIVLLFLVSATGLLLYAATGTWLVPALLIIHLATVLAFFLLSSYSKMVHGFYRFAALVREAQIAAR